MSPEQLLKKRVKVIADYPFSPYKIGDLVIFSGTTSVYPSFHLVNIPYEMEYTTKKGKNPFWESIDYLDTHPHLFKPLQWWEERKPEEMSEYVKWTLTPNEVSFFRVEAIYSNPNIGELAGIYVEGGHRLFIRDCQPVTLEEYNNYINSKK